jgi:nicotinamide mononucleotide adenylyltransferase
MNMSVNRPPPHHGHISLVSSLLAGPEAVLIALVSHSSPLALQLVDLEL